MRGSSHLVEDCDLWDFRCASKDIRILGSNYSFENGSTRKGWVTFEWIPVEAQPRCTFDLARNCLCKSPPKPALALSGRAGSVAP